MESVKTTNRGGAVDMNQRIPMVPVAPAAGGATMPASSPLAPPPSRSSSSPTSASPPASTPPLALVLDELTASVDGVNGALLASVDGFAVARSSTMPNSAAHAAILAAGMGLAHQLAAMGGGTELRQLVIDHDEGLLLLWPLGAKRVLALLTTRRVDQQAMRQFVQAKAHWLAGDR